MNGEKFLSDEELRNIRHRTNAATQGPWLVHETKVDAFVTDKSIISAWESPELKWPMPIVSMTVAEQSVGVWMKSEDANFMANARADIPELIGMLDAMGHKLVYSALMEYARRRMLRDEDAMIVERAMEVVWRILKSRETSSDDQK